MVWPLDRVTTTGEPVTGADTDAVYTTVPPSATFAVALSETVLVSMVSVTVVTAGAVLGTRFSKLPPVAVEMVAWIVPASL
ncbi:hypothetical protein SRABI130_05977 [Pseudomonas sp. Bi130]|nr:hypothetical protein SRABI130_05977 [Pseudomonas sp. Bi130]